MTNDEIIEYGLKHEDETVRELARRFSEYRELVHKYTVSVEINYKIGAIK